MRFHLPALNHGVMDPAPARYTIRINGHLGATVLSAFPAMASRLQGAETVLTGLLDRSALYGVLAEVEALGLDLLELRQGQLAVVRRCVEGHGPPPGACGQIWLGSLEADLLADEDDVDAAGQFLVD